MNLPNKLTFFRIILTFVIIFILLFPFHYINFEFPTLFINDKIMYSSKYLVSAILFIIASITDWVDGYIARKYKLITEFGKIIDAIADKILVSSILIILAAQGIIPAIIPVIIILRDIIVDTLKLIIGSNSSAVGASIMGKIKTAFLMIGVTFALLNNLPFELIGINVTDIILIIASVLAIISGIQYFNMSKKYFKKEEFVK